MIGYITLALSIAYKLANGILILFQD
jgi:hypothetical protein